jgi:hypothetical protein
VVSSLRRLASPSFFDTPGEGDNGYHLQMIDAVMWASHAQNRQRCIAPPTACSSCRKRMLCVVEETRQLGAASHLNGNKRAMMTSRRQSEEQPLAAKRVTSPMRRSIVAQSRAVNCFRA